MSQWGKNDQAVTANSTTTAVRTTGAPVGVAALVKAGGGPNAHFGNTSGTRASADVNLFGNTTVGAFIPGAAIGVFGVDTAEVAAANGGLTRAQVVVGGSGYGAAPVVTVGAANVTSVNSSITLGKVSALTVNVAGSYATVPSITIAPPASINVVANTTGFSNTADTLIVTSANSRFSAGDRLYYGVPTANTPIAPLAGNTYYYVSFANTTVLKLSSTLGGANIDLTDARAAAGETHTIVGDTATAALTIGGGKTRGIAHAGWVLRTEGTGGRAGRVQYETLVAMSSISTDASDDTILPDA